MAGKTAEEKVKFVLDSVKQDAVVVIEDELAPEEKRMLISQTMKSVSKTFPGIEVSSLSPESDDLRKALIRLLGGKTGLTIVGPSTLVKQVKRDPGRLKLFLR